MAVYEYVGHGAGADGTIFGYSSTKKIGFHGTTPTEQRANASQAAMGTTAVTTTTPYGFGTSTQATSVITLLNELRAALVAKGLIKGSA